MKPNLIGLTISRALNSAGLMPDSKRHAQIRRVIDRALAAAGLAGPVARDASTTMRRQSEPRHAHAPAQAPAGAEALGDFVKRTHQGARGKLDYKLYVPSSYDGTAMPLIVMLHGCKQNPDDFAAGTRMNEHAERRGFLVAYPAQTARANGANCWNWFEPEQQSREGVEPSLLAGIAADIVSAYAVQPARTFVAGLSAGAAMAVILGNAHPQVFAGVAAHSGLPIGAAHDVASAFAAMRGATSVRTAGKVVATPVRTIVFHGDADATVSPSNGAAITLEAVDGFERRGERLERLTRTDVESNRSRATTTEFRDESGTVLVEEWVVHGAAHAWSGGSSAGSFTDTAGPDASEEIVRFFLQDC